MPWKPPAPAPKCPKCGKSVYAQEEVLGCGQKWHKACYTCGLCKRPLAKGMELEFKGEDGVTRPYCTKPCHATVSGLGGFRAGGGATGTGATGIGHGGN